MAYMIASTARNFGIEDKIPGAAEANRERELMEKKDKDSKKGTEHNKNNTSAGTEHNNDYNSIINGIQ